MKSGELTKILKRNGCYLLRHGSNHDMCFSPSTNKQFAVPMHKDEIKTGTAKKILKDAGIE